MLGALGAALLKQRAVRKSACPQNEKNLGSSFNSAPDNLCNLEKNHLIPLIPLSLSEEEEEGRRVLP